METINKDQLIDGHYYVNRNSGRGMRIGMWSRFHQCFLCWKPEFNWIPYHMSHLDDEKNFIYFDPIYDLTEFTKTIKEQDNDT